MKEIKIDTPEGQFVIVYQLLDGYRILRIKDWIVSSALHKDIDGCINRLESIYGKENIKVMS